MKHIGDVKKIDGAKIEPVDIITFGSPCQDVSVANTARRGMKHEDMGDDETTRSGMFFEAIRVIREMRGKDGTDSKSDQLVRHPRYAIYENVPGAFSSNSGADFQTVLTEFVKVADENAPDVPMPEKGKWPHSGSIAGVGDNGRPFSVAWRLHDAQWWGVPQRRKRICVLADFDGDTAPWILFDPQFERTSEDRH